MDAMKKLFTNNDDASTSKNIVQLLSDTLDEGRGFCPRKLLHKYAELAQTLHNKVAQGMELSNDEETWLNDFMEHLPIAMKTELDMDEMAANRAKPSNSDYASPGSAGEAAGVTADKSLTDRPLPLLPAEQLKPPTIKLNELVITPERFDGKKGEARSWLDGFEAAIQANGWTQRSAVRYFPTFLKGSARDWFTGMVQPKLSSYTDWPQLRRKFVRYYIGPEESAAMRHELQVARQRPNEPATSFLARIIILMNRVDPHQEEHDRVQDIKNKLLNAYQARMVGIKITSIDELSDLCHEIENHLEKTAKISQARPKGEAENASGKPNEDKPSSTDKKAPGKRAPRPKYHCDFCGKDGHSEQRCWTKHGKPVRSTADAEKEDSEAPEVVREEVCLTISVEDPQPLQQAPVVTTEICSVVATVGKSDGIFHKVAINGQEDDALFDTGSNLSLIRGDEAGRMKLELDTTTVKLINADCQPIQVMGQSKVNLMITIGKVRKFADVTFVIVKNLCVRVLIGIVIQGWFDIVLHTLNRSISFGDTQEPKATNAITTRNRSGLRVRESTKLKGRSQQTVVCNLSENLPASDILLTKPFDLTPPGVIVAHSVAKNEDGLVPVMVANTLGKDITLEAGLQVATYEHLWEISPHLLCASSSQADEPCLNITTPLQMEGDNVPISVGDNLTAVQQVELLEVIKRHTKAFAIRGRIGETDLVEHHIELTPNAKPIAERLRRRPVPDQEETRRQVREMLKKGVIEESRSPWAAAYVLVKKKTGEKRLCLDYRKLNDVTIKNAYPLPNVEDCLEPLSNNRYFTQLDLNSGYWQIRLTKEAKEMSAFRTEDGHYQFCRMPFGLCNAPASFQRLVNTLFAGLKGIHLQCFIDDVCLATTDWVEHLKLLDKVLDIVEKANLTLKPSKCIFGANRVTFLGHELSETGIRADPEKLKAIRDLPEPTSSREVRQVMGLMSYYRRFVPNFATIAEPLTSLMRKNVPFLWNEQHRAAFVELKNKLCSNPALGHFNHHEPIVLKTDASGKGVGGILLQQQAQNWVLVACCSRRISKTEENYAATDLEGLAVVFAMTRFRNYLLGKHFVLLTDHCALCALRKRTPNSPRLRRWALLLSEFDFEVQYIRGALHQDVDCLSRAPIPDKVDEHLGEKCLATEARTPLTVAALQIQPDAEWRKASELDSDAITHWAKARSRAKGYKIYGGCLYLENRLYVPASKREELLRAAHDEEPSCHGGSRATAERLKGFWWPTLAEDVRAYVAKCDLCQKRKAERVRKAGSMQSFEVVVPLQLVAFDALGPLPESLSGKKHVIVAICCFSRYVDASATEDVKGTTFASILMSFIGRFGPPQAILTDGAPTFNNADVKNILEVYKIGHRVATPHHHEGNAIVERAIQSLQEKLSLLTHDPATSLDWETNLPAAVLSLNSTTHSSTGASPYKLLFGLEYPLRVEGLESAETASSLYAETREYRMREAHQNALGNLRLAQERSRPYFENKRREWEPQVGEQVLTKVMGRRSKLQNRYAGPYKVVSRERDVYELELMGGRKENLTRHVGDLKPYRAATAFQLLSTLLITSLLLAGCLATSVRFEEAPPVLWQSTKTYVSPSVTRFKFALTFGDPCEFLRRFPWPPNANPEINTAVNQCKAVYSEQITSRAQNLAHNAPMASIALSPVQQGPGHPKPPSQTNTNSVPRHNRRRRVADKTNTNDTGEEEDANDNEAIGSEDASTNGVVTPTKLVTQTSTEAPPEKRELMSFLTGAFLSTIVDTVMERLWPDPAISELRERQHAIGSKLESLIKGINITQYQLQVLSESYDLQQRLAQHQIEQIQSFLFSIPRLSVITSSIIAKITLTGAYIERLRVAFRARRPDMLTMSLLFQSDIMLDIDPSSIIENSIAITSPYKDALTFEFTGRIRAPDTAVYRVTAFRFWAELLEDRAKLQEYQGPRYLIHNSSSNCIRGISEPRTSYVTAQCAETDFLDQRLGFWKTVEESDDPTQLKTTQTEVHEAWPYVLIYCYPSTITVDRAKMACPPYVFRLNATCAWSTPTYDYSPKAIEVVSSEMALPLIANVEHVHLKENSSIIYKGAAVRRIKELARQLKQTQSESVLVEYRGVRVRHSYVAYAAIAVSSFVVICYARHVWISVKLINQLKRAAQERSRPLRTFSVETNARAKPVIYDIWRGSRSSVA